jgi:hypothetical protein
MSSGIEPVLRLILAAIDHIGVEGPLTLPRPMNDISAE